MKEKSSGWSLLEKAGLFRRGVHADTKIDAKAYNGQRIEIKVVPITVNGGKDTLFVPPPEEAEKVSIIFERRQYSL
ncbi:hypothetical protein M1615_02935 [Patescibacteria group bacterium]|nr:hypothetical protein [Patescibacteria group bacterium]